jgi:predicted GIY-YIG superfamily endonuclease
MFNLYIIHSDDSTRFYIGITKNEISKRLNGHKALARSGINRPICRWLMKHYDTAQITVVAAYATKEKACDAEIAYIAFNKEHNKEDILNIASGGEGGFVLTDPSEIISWREKLKKARVGRKPALGLKHTDANKELFRQQTSAREPKYPIQEVIRMTFKKANAKYNISKSQYLRLRHKYGFDLVNQGELKENPKEQFPN